GPDRKTGRISAGSHPMIVRRGVRGSDLMDICKNVHLVSHGDGSQYRGRRLTGGGQGCPPPPQCLHEPGRPEVNSSGWRWRRRRIVNNGPATTCPQKSCVVKTLPELAFSSPTPAASTK